MVVAIGEYHAANGSRIARRSRVPLADAWWLGGAGRGFRRHRLATHIDGGRSDFGPYLHPAGQHHRQLRDRDGHQIPPGQTVWRSEESRPVLILCRNEKEPFGLPQYVPLHQPRE